MRTPAEIFRHPSVPFTIGSILCLGLVLEGSTPFPLTFLIPLLVALLDEITRLRTHGAAPPEPNTTKGAREG